MLAIILHTSAFSFRANFQSWSFIPSSFDTLIGTAKVIQTSAKILSKFYIQNFKNVTQIFPSSNAVSCFYPWLMSQFLQSGASLWRWNRERNHSIDEHMCSLCIFQHWKYIKCDINIKWIKMRKTSSRAACPYSVMMCCNKTIVEFIQWSAWSDEMYTALFVCGPLRDLVSTWTFTLS